MRIFVSEAAETTRVPQRTIKLWVKRSWLPVPKRLDHGQRKLCWSGDAAYVRLIRLRLRQLAAHHRNDLELFVDWIGHRRQAIAAINDSEMPDIIVAHTADELSVPAPVPPPLHSPPSDFLIIECG